MGLFHESYQELWVITDVLESVPSQWHWSWIYEPKSLAWFVCNRHKHVFGFCADIPLSDILTTAEMATLELSQDQNKSKGFTVNIFGTNKFSICDANHFDTFQTFSKELTWKNVYFCTEFQNAWFSFQGKTKINVTILTFSVKWNYCSLLRLYAKYDLMLRWI